MKKQIISSFIVLCLVSMLSVAAVASQSDTDKVETWGRNVQMYVTNPIEEDPAVIQSLEETVNNEVILPQVEISQAKDFYISAGYEESEAADLAFTYVKDINTLYQEAIKNGYMVSDDEISAYLEQLKIDFQTAENKDEIYRFINSFESEEAYWNFQFEMFRKDLPIQKYVSDMEKEFINARISKESNSRSYSEQEYADEFMEAQDEWVTQFENIKDEAENSYNYTVE